MTFLISALRQIDRKGCAGRKIYQPLLAKGLIEVCASRPEINRPYSSYRLTDNGRKTLELAANVSALDKR